MELILCILIFYISTSNSVDCVWKPYVNRLSSCDNTCGFGQYSWTREKSVNESNGGFCNNTLASGIEQCYECGEIGILFY